MKKSWQNSEHSDITKISQVAYLKDLGSHIRIVVNHHDLFEYKKGDKISEITAMVMLVKSGAANRTEVAQVFSVSRRTVYRYLNLVEKYGSAGLIVTKTGPQRPHKITPKVHQFIADRLCENKGIACILRALKDEFDLELSRTSIERIRESLPPKKVEVKKPVFVPQALPFMEGIDECIEESVDEEATKPLVSCQVSSVEWFINVAAVLVPAFSQQETG